MPIFTENRIPDSSTADYAIGQSHIKYLDRYFKFPIFLLKNNIIKEKTSPHLYLLDSNFSKISICSIRMSTFLTLQIYRKTQKNAAKFFLWRDYYF